MALNNGIITAPVTDSDLKTLFGVGNDISDWCNNGAINKFARYKSLRYPQAEPITNAQRQSVAHGLTFPNVVTIAGSAFGNNSTTYNAIIDACANDWGYDMPNGGANAPYRQTDFANAEYPSQYGYYHYAVPPIQVNYPRDGWTFLRGSNQSRTLVISVDLDPDDSAINLQSYDLVAAGLNLNEWTLIAYIDDSHLINRLYDSDDTILNGGEISGNTIAITFPSGTGSWDSDLYICMYRHNNSTGQYEFVPLPKQGDYNPEYYTLHIIDDAQQSGGGISGNDTEEMFNQVLFSYNLNGTYKTAWETTDNGTAKYCMKCFGSLYVKMTLTNTSSTTKNVTRASLQCNLNDTGAVSASTMYDSNKNVISSVNIAGNGGMATIYLEYDNIFARLGGEWTNSNKNSSWSMDFTRDGATLFGGDIYAMYGSDDWVARSS